MKKVLFISHEANYSGAPIVLLHFLKWFKENTNISFEILLRKNGVLQSDFQAIAPTLLFEELAPSQKSLKGRVLRRFGLQGEDKIYLKRLAKKMSQNNIGLIYSNTVVNGDILELLCELDCPVICHVHELEYAIRFGAGLENFEKIKKATHHYIAVSNAVKENLIKNHNILDERVSVVHEFIPAIFPSLDKADGNKNEIHRRLNIPVNAKIVCASGTTEWRKGTDLFVQLARTVLEKYSSPVHFIWVGGVNNGARYYYELSHDVKNAGLEECVHFLGEQLNPSEYFKSSDVFTLLSREDPFPLVCLEAASLGKPIICFDNAGGEKEFVEEDSGFIVPYLDIAQMAEKVIALLNSPDLCQRLGERAKQKVRERHSVEITSPQIKKIIEKFLEDSKSVEH